jgi:hypothetical protein
MAERTLGGWHHHVDPRDDEGRAKYPKFLAKPLHGALNVKRYFGRF